MKSKSKQILAFGVLILILLLIISVSKKSPSQNQVVAPVKDSTPTASIAFGIGNHMNLPGMQATLDWVVETDHLKERLTAIGLPALSEEGSALHIHQHMDIYINGVKYPVSPGIGINEAEHFIAPIHTHDDTGVIHVESPTVQNFTLGQFFDIWGVNFTSTCISGFCNEGDYTLKVYINGKLFPSDVDARNIDLEAHQEIAIIYGNDGKNPVVVPTTYTFPDGE